MVKVIKVTNETATNSNREGTLEVIKNECRLMSFEEKCIVRIEHAGQTLACYRYGVSWTARDIEADRAI